MVGKIAHIDKSVGNILCEDSDVSVVGAHVSLIIICTINLNERFVAPVPVKVCFQLLVLMEFGVVFDEMLLSKVTVLILIYLMPVILSDEVPAEPRQGMRATTHQ